MPAWRSRSARRISAFSAVIVCSRRASSAQTLDRAAAEELLVPRPAPDQPSSCDIASNSGSSVPFDHEPTT
jgi:hypothetical protein